MNKLKIDELVSLFLRFEKKHQLLEQHIAGVYFWQIIRFRVYLNMTKDIGLFNIPHSKKMDAKAIASNFIFLIYHFLAHDLFIRIKRVRKTSLLFRLNGRKQDYKGSLEDVYLYPIQEQINLYDCYSLDPPFLLRHSKKRGQRMIFTDGLILKKVLHYIIRRKNMLSEKEIDTINQIDDAFFKQFGAHANIKSYIHKVISAFYSEKEYYQKKIKKISPSALFLTVSYGDHASLICAAKELGVPVIEVQHGNIDSLHIGYNHAYKTIINDYCPDYFFSFGKYWHSQLSLPIDDENIIDFGFPFFHYQKSCFSRINKERESILFISQGTIGKQLAQYAYGIAKEYPDYSVFFKLHPGEFKRWRNEYPALLKADLLQNFRVVEDEVVLYELFAKAEFQVGVYSTAIYEGLGFDCKTILVDLPGVEMMRNLTDKGYVRLVRNQNELSKQIKFFTVEQQVNAEYFFGKGKDIEELLASLCLKNC